MSLLVRLTNNSVNVPYSPTTTISSVISSALKKGNIDTKPTDHFVLRYNNKDLEHSHTLKRAGVAQGSTVTLHRVKQSKGKQTKVALQLPGGKRVFGNFPLNNTLWDILVYFESEIGKNICSSLDENYSYPQLTFMNRKFDSISALQSNTIALLGAQNGLFRLSFGTETGKTVRDLGITKIEEKSTTKNEPTTDCQDSEIKDKSDPMEIENQEISSKNPEPISAIAPNDNDLMNTKTNETRQQDKESKQEDVTNEGNFDRKLKYFPVLSSVKTKTNPQGMFYSLLPLRYLSLFYYSRTF